MVSIPTPDFFWNAGASQREPQNEQDRRITDSQEDWQLVVERALSDKSKGLCFNSQPGESDKDPL